jgi:hypothetical protein
LAPRPGSLESGRPPPELVLQHVVALSSSRRGGFSGGHLHRLGGFSGILLSPWCHVFNGHRRRDITSLGLSTCRQEVKCISHTGDYDYSFGLITPERVLTFNDAGLRQCSLNGRHLGFCLRSGSGLLSGRRGFFFRHH